MTTRRQFVASLAAPAPVRPNVLFLMADQLRFDALSVAGNRIVETPHLDRLARDGARFVRATCTSPLCGPSRASLLTGRFQHGHRCPGNAEINRPGLPEDVETWEEILHRNGYHSEYHGKWHTGSAHRDIYSDGLPDYLELYHEYLLQRYPGRGKQNGEAIDRYSRWPYRPVEVDRMMARAVRDGLVMPHHNEAGEHTAKPEDSLTAWTAARAIRFLDSRPSGPFSLTCSFLHPHAPLIAPRPYFDMYKPEKMPMPEVLDDVFTAPAKAAIPQAVPLNAAGMGSYISLYWGLVKELDDWVGRILAALDRSGQANNTLVVFLSDHGEMLGEHARVSKMVFYEASLRVPLLMRFPGRIRKGTVVDAPATGADIAPTILDYLGVPVPAAMHGASLRPAIEGKRPRFDGAYAELIAQPVRPEGQRILRTREWKLAFRAGKPYLYHLEADPRETVNLIDAGRTRDLQQARLLQSQMLAQMEEARNPERDWLQGRKI